MALPYTFIAGTVIDPSQVNTNFTYLETLAGGALLRDGSNIMLAPLPLAAGTLALPGLTFSGDTNTGMYRSGADTFVFVAGGVAQAVVGTTGLAVSTLAVTNLTVSSLALLSPLAVAYGGTGAVTLTGLLKGNGTGAITGSATINDSNWSGTALALGNGGSGQTTAAAAATAFGLGVGNSPTFVALTLTNGQLVFPAVAVPSAGANTLDDYAEGTFVPTIAFGGASVGTTYSTQTGSYTKIGRIVFFRVTIVLSARGSSTGVVTIQTLPFTPAQAGMVSGWVGNFTVGAGLIPQFDTSSTSIRVRSLNQTTGADASVAETAVANNFAVFLKGFFEI